MYSAILFDLDGLLIDSEAIFHAVELDLLREAGASEEAARAALNDLIGRDEATGSALLAERFPEIDRAAMAGPRRTRIKAAMAQGIPVRPRVFDLLDALDALRLPRAVATNSSHAGALRKLSDAGLDRRVDAVVGHDMVARPKPDPDVYTEAARLLGVPPSACLAFEDSELGAQAAHAAGCTVVQVPNLAPSVGRYAHHVAETVWHGALSAGLRLPGGPEDS